MVSLMFTLKERKIKWFNEDKTIYYKVHSEYKTSNYVLQDNKT